MKIGVVGCAGRMGRMLVHAIINNPKTAISGGTETPGHPGINKDITTLAGTSPQGIKIGQDPASLFSLSDAVVDFTTPTATMDHVRYARENGTVLIIGTTGFSKEQQQKINEAASQVVIVQSANMSVGVNVLFALVDQVARIVDQGYDIEVLEMHHRHKVDAPSGTALALGHILAKARGAELSSVAKKARDGHVGKRTTGEIGFATLRGGDVVGDHTVIYAGEGERIEISHKASHRSIFAQGAIRAALWCRGKKPGLYSMADVLELYDRIP